MFDAGCISNREYAVDFDNSVHSGERMSLETVQQEWRLVQRRLSFTKAGNVPQERVGFLALCSYRCLHTRAGLYSQNVLFASTRGIKVAAASLCGLS